MGYPSYQIKPISKITHIAEIDNIQPYENTGKFVVNFKEAASEIGCVSCAYCVVC